MKKQILFAVVALVSLSGMAQEPAKYRITYDCDAQLVTGKLEKPRVFDPRGQSPVDPLKSFLFDP